MVHLVIKELANCAEDIIMVTSTIMKDTGGGSDAIFRPNAIRALCRIIDVRLCLRALSAGGADAHRRQQPYSRLSAS